MSNAHTFVGPSIAASGITFAQYTSLGAEGHLERFVAAYSGGIAAPAAAFTWSATGGGTSGGSLAAGTLYGLVTATDGIGETTASPVSAQITVAAGDQPEITAFPAKPTGWVAWNVYLGLPGGASTGPFYLYQLGVTASTLVLTAAAPTTSDSMMTPPASNGTVWGEIRYRLIRYAKTGQFQKLFAFHRQEQSTYSSGEPKSFADCVQKTRDTLFAYAIFQAAQLEAGAIIVANPGHLVSASTGIGGVKSQRTWP